MQYNLNHCPLVLSHFPTVWSDYTSSLAPPHPNLEFRLQRQRHRACVVSLSPGQSSGRLCFLFPLGCTLAHCHLPFAVVIGARTDQCLFGVGCALFLLEFLIFFSLQPVPRHWDFSYTVPSPHNIPSAILIVCTQLQISIGAQGTPRSVLDPTRPRGSRIGKP